MVKWSARLGGFWTVFDDGMRLDKLAKMARIKPEDCGIKFVAMNGTRAMKLARIILGAAAGRTVSEEEIDLRPATSAELSLWERHRRTEDALRPAARKAPAQEEQLPL